MVTMQKVRTTTTTTPSISRATGRRMLVDEMFLVLFMTGQKRKVVAKC